MESIAAINLMWVMISAALVMFMQAGFCLLESGMARSKNSINVAIKNLVDLCVSGLLFWAVGFGLMFGMTASGWFGTDGFFLRGIGSPEALAFFLFQFVFCGTATTIISGAAAERMHFRGYMVVAALTSGLLYPIFGHWAWGSACPGAGGEPGWLEAMGFVDFAGSTVVHSVGGWIALATVLVLGPRLGQYPRENGRAMGRRPRGFAQRSIQGHDLALATVGVFILWFGWFGFNGGSTLAMDERVPLILVNTNLAAAAGGAVALTIAWVHEGRPVVAQLLVGIVAGLVSITAGCHLMTPFSAIVIGAIGGAIGCGGVYLLPKLRIDDVVGAIPAHAFAGAWGTLAVAIMAAPEDLPTGDRWAQFLVQLTGVGAAMAWAFGIGWLVIVGISRFVQMRATVREEWVGLNYSEHGASTALIDLATEMHKHRRTRSFGRRVQVDRYTEAGQIANAYNRVLTEVEAEIIRRDEAEQRYRNIVENAVEGIFQTSPDGQFQSANPSLLKIYGDASLEALRNRVSSVGSQLYVDPHRRDEFAQLIESERIVRDFRSQVYRADGEIIWVSESARAVRDADQNLLYYEGTVVDATDRIHAEQLQRERDIAEAASEAKSQFLARMSHEMRTPLGGVINTLELIADDTPPAQRKQFIEIAKQSAQSLLTLINDILDLSKVESGKLDLELVETEPESVVRIAVEMLYHHARSKGLRLAAEIDPHLPKSLRIDGSRVRQLLVNLIGNAIKFTPSGEITVLASWIEPTTDTGALAEAKGDAAKKGPAAGRLRCSVSDTGIGIPEERIEKIFEAFVQADVSTTRRFGGSGLGLAICKQLVELMGGKLGVESVVNQGSTFWFEIPAERGVGPENGTSSRLHAAKPEGLVATGLKGLPVLLIAPRHNETRAITTYLRNWGLDPEICSDMEQCEKVITETRANRGSFSLTLVDAERESQWRALSQDPRWTDLASVCRGPIVWIGVPRGEVAPPSVMLPQPVPASALLETLQQLLLAGEHPVNLAEVVSSRVTPTSCATGPATLVVDDNEVNRMIAAEMLRRLGYRPLIASSGAEAMELAQESPIELVLMDCEMPEMDGFQTTQALRELHRVGKLATVENNPLRIIACTAQAIAGDRERCLAGGMDDYITKPIRQAELVAALERVSSRKPPIELDELRHRCGDDRDLMENVLRAFARRGPEDVRQLVTATNGSSKQVSAAAHRLKGAASTMAAHELATLAIKIEEIAAVGDAPPPAAYQSSIQEVHAEMTRCIDWIEHWLKELQR